MIDRNAELEALRAGVSCATLLEKLPPQWKLDKKGSTKNSLKYRRGAGEVLIVNHKGRGWWNPLSADKGDVFNLVQFLRPGLNFRQVRQVLQPFVGVAPTFPEALRKEKPGPRRSPAERWKTRPQLRPGSPGWNYLAEERALPDQVIQRAVDLDVIREGWKGSVWFAHLRDASVTHVEARGPDFRGSLCGGQKTLFEFPGAGTDRSRLAISEAPIDALSMAAIEGVRPDTVYLATGGGMGPSTIAALEAWLLRIAAAPNAILVSATDADDAGDRYAARQAELAAAAAVAWERLRPTNANDWNDTLQAGRGQ